MCRWLAYSGSPIPLEDVLFKPAHSLVVQSLHAEQGIETTNGDGFGMGWYGRAPEPRLYRSISPAWNDRNLRELASEIESELFFAHIRASTGTSVQQTNCHPFRVGRWLWMHNGLIREFAKLKHELALSVDPQLYPLIEGTTDSELMFFLALTEGLDDDPPGAVARMVGRVEAAGRRRGIEFPMRMTIAVSNGEDLWAFRYSSDGQPGTLYYSTEIPTLRKLYPDNPRFTTVSPETRMIVSEPLVDLPGAWNAFPPSTWGMVRPGHDLLREFRPVAPA